MIYSSKGLRNLDLTEFFTRLLLFPYKKMWHINSHLRGRGGLVSRMNSPDSGEEDSVVDTRNDMGQNDYPQEDK